ncbi:hypothetical protein FOMPIDRAFT_1056552 [Fomitopsis schrenkii]|uniref:Uncharacterized protein n=1 Tax=Fomitopsis schrenkii TaxID=2126942 RepID=S8DIY1_FOMSC|nr:hypothetical protein FOMPIDRAFT_1056552 [Fomitopsis schrenkii]
MGLWLRSMLRVAVRHAGTVRRDKLRENDLRLQIVSAALFDFPPSILCVLHRDPLKTPSRQRVCSIFLHDHSRGHTSGRVMEIPCPRRAGSKPFLTWLSVFPLSFRRGW